MGNKPNIKSKLSQRIKAEQRRKAIGEGAPRLKVRKNLGTTPTLPKWYVSTRNKLKSSLHRLSRDYKEKEATQLNVLESNLVIAVQDTLRTNLIEKYLFFLNLTDFA
jgi:hypothetical protein